MRELTGIHHITAIAGDAQENLDFYAGALGMRLVKRSVNQDDPATYHLFFADAEGSPGTDITFFPWQQMAPSRKGTGLAVEVMLAVAPGSFDYWRERLREHGVRHGELEERRGELALPLVDVHGLELALVETRDVRPFVPWPRSPVPEAYQVRGLHGVRLWERELEPTVRFLTEVMGFASAGEKDGWHRLTLGDGGSRAWLEVREVPDGRRGAWGIGAVHHVAWRAPSDADQLAVRSRVEAAGRHPTSVIDRFWFRSVYFKEPGGVLFELATDDPGFTVDEDLETLGEQLILPPWLEESRQQIEAGLPPLRYSPG
jgi:glyoxalase family protein